MFGTAFGTALLSSIIQGKQRHWDYLSVSICAGLLFASLCALIAIFKVKHAMSLVFKKSSVPCEVYGAVFAVHTLGMVAVIWSLVHQIYIASHL